MTVLTLQERGDSQPTHRAEQKPMGEGALGTIKPDGVEASQQGRPQVL